MKLILVLISIVSVTAAAKGERKVACTLKVDGVTYLNNEKCVFKSEKDGSFSIGVSDNQKSRSKYFAYVTLEDGTATGAWNGKDAETHAQQTLGVLKNQKNGCWTNEHATVCAK